MTKVKCATIGLGDIGTDLLNKLMRSDVLEPVWMVSVSFWRRCRSQQAFVEDALGS